MSQQPVETPLYFTVCVTRLGNTFLVHGKLLIQCSLEPVSNLVYDGRNAIQWCMVVTRGVSRLVASQCSLSLSLSLILKP